MDKQTKSQPGYEYLVVYMLGKVIQDLTGEFCQKFLKDANDPKFPNYRTIEQMEQAARSNSTLNTPNLPKGPTEAANMLLTFCNMEGFLLKNLVESLKQKHKKEGGLTEKLYRKRIEYRNRKASGPVGQRPGGRKHRGY